MRRTVLTPAMMQPSPSPGKMYCATDGVSSDCGTGPTEYEGADHVVSLPGLSKLALIHDRIERAPARKHDGPLGRLHRLLERALSLRDRVTKREHDRSLIQFRHGRHRRVRERPANGRQAHQRRRAHVRDHFLQRAQLRRVWLGAREETLVRGELVAAIVGYEALRVHEGTSAR